jgi:hypothetical protein
MKIKVAEVIEWDDTLPVEEQSPMAQAWFMENVQSKITFYDDQKGIKPKFDKYGRPEKWVVELPTCTVELKWNYQKKDSSEWTKGKDSVSLKIKA